MELTVKHSSPRVVHAPTTVGGNPQGLSNALKKMGLFSESVTLQQNYFKYAADYVWWQKTDNVLVREVKRIFLIFFILFRYDIVHYNFGTTVAMPPYWARWSSSSVREIAKTCYSHYAWALQFIELNLFKLFGKRLYVTYQGNDARQGDYSLAHFQYSIASQVGDEYYDSASDSMKRKMIARLSQYCDEVYSLNPDLLHVLPEHAKFMPYAHIFLDEWTPSFNQLENRKLRIGHAPSHRKVKGTALILEAAKALESQGHDFELILIEGLSHADAKKLYKTVDVVIDQLFAGWYGGLAVEAMALGKPVAVYIRDEDLRYIPKEMVEDLPFFKVTPDDFEEKLKELITMPRETLLAMAKQSRAYVEKWHDPLKIAAELKRTYEETM